MARCVHRYADNAQCKRIVETGETYCYSHDPARQEERKRNARKGGKRGGRGRPSAEVNAAKAEIRRIIDALEEGTIETKVGATMFQGWNLMLRALETERNIIETQQLAEMVEELYESHEKGRHAL